MENVSKRMGELLGRMVLKARDCYGNDMAEATMMAFLGGYVDGLLEALEPHPDALLEAGAKLAGQTVNDFCAGLVLIAIRWGKIPPEKLRNVVTEEGLGG